MVRPRVQENVAELSEDQLARATLGVTMTNDRDAEIVRRYRSARPLRREILLVMLSVITFLLAYFELTPYPATNLFGLGWGLMIGAIVSYTVRLSRR
jgi:hypothetical protein